jgi:hypothetical protein
MGSKEPFMERGYEVFSFLFRALLSVGIIFLMLSCGRSQEKSFSSIASLGQASLFLLEKSQKPLPQIIDSNQLMYYRSLLPQTFDLKLNGLLKSESTIWYDGRAIVPGYQDSMGDPIGFRANTISPGLINLAVPGGWERLFSKSGRFNFPFGTGGADHSDNFDKINFWNVPLRANGEPLPVVYWKVSGQRWRWMFPVGTTFGEVLMMSYEDGSKAVFEVRTRTRVIDGWQSKVYRPYSTSQELAQTIRQEFTMWEQVPELKNLVNHLEGQVPLIARTLRTQHFANSVADISGNLDILPPLSNENMVKRILQIKPFKSVGETPWKNAGGKVTHAPTVTSGYSIVARNYDGGVLAVNDQSCKRCHDQAGREIRDFHSDLILYGELWGEDQIFSWHPFDNDEFVNPDGTVRNFNYDNRQLRSEFVEAGLIISFNPNQHRAPLYQELEKDWQHTPVLKRGERL